MNRHSSIFIAGCESYVGKALRRRLLSEGFNNCLDEIRAKVNLREQSSVEEFFRTFKPEYVFLVGGKSGGIQANIDFPADLMRDNLLVQTHVFHSAFSYCATKLLYLANSCSYPRDCRQPLKIEDLMSGPLETTNEAYAMAKLAGLAMVRAYKKQYGRNFIAGIPGNIFGPEDDFHPQSAHVIPALILRMHEARLRQDSFMEIWGTGNPLRQYIYVDDVASACLFLMKHYHGDEPINLGGMACISIRDLALKIQNIVGFEGELRFNDHKPDGMPLKALDSLPLSEMGWSPSTSLDDGLSELYEWFKPMSQQQQLDQETMKSLVN